MQTGLVALGAKRPPGLDALALARDLSARIEGEVRFDAGSRALYAADASNYRQLPIGVVVPRTVDDVVAAVEVCRAHGAPLLSRGGGTSIAGQCCNVAVVIDWSKYLDGIVSLDPHGRTARVLPGTVLDRLRDAANHFGLTFGPDPSTHAWCTIGGMIGNNSCGMHAQMAGSTAANVESLEVLTYDGLRLRVGATSDEELRAIRAAGGKRAALYEKLVAFRDRWAERIRSGYPKLPRRISGYNLPDLLPENGFHVARALVGSEGTLVTILEASVRLVPWPPCRALLLLGYPDVYVAADHVPDVAGLEPLALEGIDAKLVEDIRRKQLHPEYLRALPRGGGFLIVQFGGVTPEEARGRAAAAGAWLRRRGHPCDVAVVDDPGMQGHIWDLRESGLGATARVPGQPDSWEGWEDSAVPPERLGSYLRAFRALLDRHGYDAALYGHFGQGCLHCRIDFDLTTAAGIARYRSFVDEAADLVVAHGGSLSGEHGDGQSRAELLPKMFGPELVRAFAEFKAIWDPDGRMNPGKVVDPLPIVADLRLGAGFEDARPETFFRFPDDDGSFGRAVQRCVGVGKCRRKESGLMCPSFQVTHEEMHATRGRAHLLFEMLHKGSLGGGFRDEAVKEALDLCLACKGCKVECPVNVDMATYKAEFLAHHYAGRLRPPPAYSMGWIGLWARLAALAPALANGILQGPLGGAARTLGGIARERAIPAFAKETFRAWFARRGPSSGGRRVLLWPDTFNDHFTPERARAAVEVLEAAGFSVVLPPAWLCCGRPLYDFGMLASAKRYLRRVLDALEEELHAGTPIVGLEPSCISVFRDEARGLFPDDERAVLLQRRATLLGELLHESGWRPPRLRRRALIQFHCHHRAVLDVAKEQAFLASFVDGLDAPDAGCCGMAGSFGFEAAHYEVSQRCGERVLLPAVRASDAETLIVADGFSCREQIEQGTGRKAYHVAEVARLGLVLGG